MKPLPHYYSTRLTGGPFAYADLASGGVPGLRSAPPLQFDGPGDAWSPEQLLLGAVAGCYLFTLRAVARASQFPFVHLDVDAEGTVDRAGGTTRFTEIVLRVRLGVPAGADHDRAVRLLEKTETACLISASLSTPLRLEPDVVDVTVPAASGQ